jgi:phosphotransacetylase
MQVLEQIRARAASAPKHIVLPEGEDERTIRAASLCAHAKLAQLTLIGAEEVIRDKASDGQHLQECR